MAEFDAPNVTNQDKDPRYNAEGGLAINQGSAHQQEMARWEQFPHSKWAFGNPGNPYVYRPFPKMLFKAERFGGQLAVSVPPPVRYEFKDDRNFLAAEEAARRFTEQHQRVVKDQVEYSRAMEVGWRESPQEALDFANGRDKKYSQEVAEQNYSDRNMSEAAKAEKRAAEDEAGIPLADVPSKRRGRPRKDPAADAA